MQLKAYVAGRISRQDEIRTIVNALKKAGIAITREWTWTDSIQNETDAAAYRKREYAQPNHKYHQEAEDDLQAVLAADIFIVLTDTMGSSMYVEMGAAFAAQKLAGKPKKIYAIGPHFDRMVFYQHKDVHRVANVEEIIADLTQM
jgi:hypothetical protein